MSSRVYIGKIPRETRLRDLECFFWEFGRIRDVLIKPGYSFVEFDDYRDAEDAVRELHGKRLLGIRVEVELVRGRPRGRAERKSDRCHRHRQGPLVRTNYRVSVKNLPTDVSWQDLKNHVKPAGEVTFADAHTKYKNEGIVEFATYEDMKNAIREFDDTVLRGRRIRLFEDKIIRRSRSRSSRRTVNSRSSRSRSRSQSIPRKDQESRYYSRGRSNESRREHGGRERSMDTNNFRSRSKSNSVKRSRSRSTSSSEERFKKKRRSSIESSPYLHRF